MKLTKGKIYKLYNKKRQSQRKFKKKIKRRNYNTTFRKKRPINLHKSSLRNIHGGKYPMIGGVGQGKLTVDKYDYDDYKDPMEKDPIKSMSLGNASQHSDIDVKAYNPNTHSNNPNTHSKNDDYNDYNDPMKSMSLGSASANRNDGQLDKSQYEETGVLSNIVYQPVGTKERNQQAQNQVVVQYNNNSQSEQNSNLARGANALQFASNRTRTLLGMSPINTQGQYGNQYDQYGNQYDQYGNQHGNQYDQYGNQHGNQHNDQMAYSKLSNSPGYGTDLVATAVSSGSGSSRDSGTVLVNAIKSVVRDAVSEMNLGTPGPVNSDSSIQNPVEAFPSMVQGLTQNSGLKRQLGQYPSQTTIPVGVPIDN